MSAVEEPRPLRTIAAVSPEGIRRESELDSPDAQANVTEGSLSPEGREPLRSSGETELTATTAGAGGVLTVVALSPGEDATSDWGIFLPLPLIPDARKFNGAFQIGNALQRGIESANAASKLCRLRDKAVV